jgi:transcriptional regulator with XRE-family HTH domain
MLLMAKKKPKAGPTQFGVKLKALRIAAGLSQAKLAEAIGTIREIVVRYENSPTANPTLDTLKKLADALGCTPNDLMGYRADPAPNSGVE